MALVDWNSSLSVGVSKFDDEHKKLVDMVNNLHDAMKAGKGKEVVGTILDGLVTYTRTHFASEEKLMLQHKYPGYENHKKEHNALVMQVTDVVSQFKSGSAPLASSVLQFLVAWLTKHIKGDDKQYGAFFNNLGIN